MLLLYQGEAFNPNFYYHTGLEIDHAFFIHGKRRMLLVSKLNEELARENFEGKVVSCEDPFKELKKHLRGDVYADFSSMSMSMASRLKKVCRLKDHTKELLRQRSVKRDHEISRMKRAVKLTKQVLHSLDFRKAQTEIGLERQIRVALAEQGLEHAFDPIVSTGTSTRFPHYRARRKKLRSLVLVDMGARFSHYCADLTRCFILDGDKKKLRQYESLQNILHSIVDELPDMQTGADVAKLSLKLLEKSGLPKPPHAIGHGIGLDVHELPSLSLKSKDRLHGSVLAIEPAFYLSRYGMRFEENVIVGKKGKII